MSLSLKVLNNDNFLGACFEQIKKGHTSSLIRQLHEEQPLMAAMMVANLIRKYGKKVDQFVADLDAQVTSCAKHSELVGNPLAACLQYQSLRRKVESYFRSDSRVWRKIRDHIAEAKECLLINRLAPPWHIVCARGTGHCVDLKDFYVWGEQHPEGHDKYWNSVPAATFRISIEVTYEHDDDDYNEKKVKYELSVPSGLEDVGISDAELTLRFDIWAVECGNKLREESSRKDLATLAELVKKYPSHAASLMTHT